MQRIGGFAHQTDVMMLLRIRFFVCPQSLLPRTEETPFHIVGGMAAQSYMEGSETVVLEFNRAVFIVQRRPVERIAHRLSPVLVAGKDVMVVKVVPSADMVRNGKGMVVVDRTALVFRVKIFKDNTVQPVIGLKTILETQHPVLEVIEQIAVPLLHLPFVALPVTVIIKLEH